MKLNLLLSLLILTFKQEYQLVLAQGATCSNDNQCPNGGGGEKGTCINSLCACFIGVSGASCNTGSYTGSDCSGTACPILNGIQALCSSSKKKCYVPLALTTLVTTTTTTRTSTTSTSSSSTTRSSTTTSTTTTTTSTSTTASTTSTTTTTTKLTTTSSTTRASTTSTSTTSTTTSTSSTTITTTKTSTSTTTTSKTTNEPITVPGLNINLNSAVNALSDLNPNSGDSSKVIANLLTSPYDILDCLTSCSGNGECSFTGSKFVCICSFDYFAGTKCEIDKRLCSSFQCFNNGTCIDKIAEAKYDFECQCPFPYYGKRCESRLNLCLNSTCVNKQGKCFINGTQTMCKCYTGFSGDNCEIISAGVQMIKAVSTGSAIAAIAILVSFFIFIIFMDITKLFTGAKIPKKLKKVKVNIVQPIVQKPKYIEHPESGPKLDPIKEDLEQVASPKEKGLINIKKRINPNASYLKH